MTDPGVPHLLIVIVICVLTSFSLLVYEWLEGLCLSSGLCVPRVPSIHLAHSGSSARIWDRSEWDGFPSQLAGIERLSPAGGGCCSDDPNGSQGEGQKEPPWPVGCDCFLPVPLLPSTRVPSRPLLASALPSGLPPLGLALLVSPPSCYHSSQTPCSFFPKFMLSQMSPFIRFLRPP